MVANLRISNVSFETSSLQVCVSDPGRYAELSVETH